MNVFRCDYCGLFRPFHQANVTYVFDYEAVHNCDQQGCDNDCTTVADDVYTVSITCSPWCADRSASTARVGGR